MISEIHDSKILSYQVDFEKLELKMLIEDEGNIKHRIMFKKLLTFHFEHQLPNSILLDVIKGKIEDFLSENKELLFEGKNYYWPLDYETDEELLQYLNENSLNYYKVQSSYGLNGWILCSQYYIEE
ncbi:hypothetical protein ACEOWJ_000910 [Bacillus cereus]|uniref:hypothetical protein n=1 Tax=Bacillus TaxID=1386 RepID=UPI00055775C4|nr:hypothetical protein [Bacillus sp. UNC322MFChir4.1]